MSLKTVKQLLVDELKDIYDAEHRLTKALPKLAKAANDEALGEAFNGHLRQTEEHVVRLEKVFEALGETPKRKTCKAMVGLLEEGASIMEEAAAPGIKDLLLIAGAQKVEHYEMATYGCLRTWAQLLGEGQVVKLLQQTLDEEGAADKKLTSIAMAIQQDEPREDEAEMDDAEHAILASGSARSKGSRTSAREAKH